jgi:hypothetical protein
VATLPTHPPGQPFLRRARNHEEASPDRAA